MECTYNTCSIYISKSIQGQVHSFRGKEDLNQNWIIFLFFEYFKNVFPLKTTGSMLWNKFKIVSPKHTTRENKLWVQKKKESFQKITPEKEND